MEVNAFGPRVRNFNSKHRLRFTCNWYVIRSVSRRRRHKSTHATSTKFYFWFAVISSQRTGDCRWEWTINPQPGDAFFVFSGVAVYCAILLSFKALSMFAALQRKFLKCLACFNVPCMLPLNYKIWDCSHTQKIHYATSSYAEVETHFECFEFLKPISRRGIRKASCKPNASETEDQSWADPL